MIDVDAGQESIGSSRELQTVVLGLQRGGDRNVAQITRRPTPAPAADGSRPVRMSERVLSTRLRSPVRLRPSTAPVFPLTPTVPRFTTSNARGTGAHAEP